MTVEPGTCAEIATGAPMPAGADAVVMVEETAAAGDHDSDACACGARPEHGRRGADIMTGDLVVRAGDVLTPSRIGALAAIGRAEVTVYAKPRVAILSTGNEVVEPGRPLEAGHVYDVNRFTLAAIVAAHGGVPQPHQAAQDTIDALAEALEACGDADLIVFSGGSSVGERDLVVDLIAARGKMIFHGIAVRPGKPTAFALVRRAHRFSACPATRRRVCRMRTSCSSRSCARSRGFLRTRRARVRVPIGQPHRVDRRAASVLYGAAARRRGVTPHSRDRATSPACRKPTVTSKYRRIRAW